MFKWENTCKILQNFKYCVISTSDSSDYKVEEILFKNEWINDCMIVEVTTKKRLYYEWKVTLMICI